MVFFGGTGRLRIAEPNLPPPLRFSGGIFEGLSGGQSPRVPKSLHFSIGRTLSSISFWVGGGIVMV